ncbi:MAG: tetratricopeptide repeat protein [Myxococcales bacterium]|nr:tetratricopeptide repeat protein [Myxococcales bacterium]
MLHLGKQLRDDTPKRCPRSTRGVSIRPRTVGEPRRERLSRWHGRCSRRGGDRKHNPRKGAQTMRDFHTILRAFLGAAAFTTLIGCEEVDPSEMAGKPMVSVVTPPAPVLAPTVAPPVTVPPKAVSSPVAAVPTVQPDPGSQKPERLIAQARDAITTGELDRALKLARVAVKKAPRRSAAWNTLGRAQLKSGQRKEAIASFEKAVELNPSSSFAYNNLGLALIYQGRFDGAVQALEEATQLEPVEGYMWNNLGMAYEHLDRLEEARAAYQQAAAAEAMSAGKNLARLAGVKTVKPIRTAKADTVRSDGQTAPVVSESASEVDLPMLDEVDADSR